MVPMVCFNATRAAPHVFCDVSRCEMHFRARVEHSGKPWKPWEPCFTPPTGAPNHWPRKDQPWAK
jgi:hypothetical protein